MRKVSLREVYRCTVLSPEGKDVGTVIDVLFHPTEPRAVGYSVRPSIISGIVPLPTKYLALDKTSLSDDGALAVVAKKSAWGRSAQRAQGFEWDDTVIWYGQHIETESGEQVGKVADCLFSLEDGSAGDVQVSGGTTSDVTLGKRRIPASDIIGFSPTRHCILVRDGAACTQFEGGAADVAGRAVGKVTATAAIHGEKAAEAVVVAAAKATVYTQAAVKRAAKSDAGKKAKSWFSAIVNDVKDAMGPDDED